MKVGEILYKGEGANKIILLFKIITTNLYDLVYKSQNVLSYYFNIFFFYSFTEIIALLSLFPNCFPSCLCVGKLLNSIICHFEQVFLLHGQ